MVFDSYRSDSYGFSSTSRVQFYKCGEYGRLAVVRLISKGIAMIAPRTVKIVDLKK